MNKDNIPKALLALAVFVTLGIWYYRASSQEDYPGENAYRMANSRLEKGEYAEALRGFDEALGKNPDFSPAYLGKGIAYMQLEEYDEALVAMDKAIALDENFAECYANRGILHDRMGRYQEAIDDYVKAARLKPELAEGPGFLWRFLHNVSEKPPTILERAAYLAVELKKSEDERLLKIPEIDARQRMYQKK